MDYHVGPPHISAIRIKLQPAGTFKTNANGEFSLPRLKSGDYFVEDLDRKLTMPTLRVSKGFGMRKCSQPIQVTNAKAQ